MAPRICSYLPHSFISADNRGFGYRVAYHWIIQGATYALAFRICPILFWRILVSTGTSPLHHKLADFTAHHFSPRTNSLTETCVLHNYLTPQALPCPRASSITPTPTHTHILPSHSKRLENHLTPQTDRKIKPSFPTLLPLLTPQPPAPIPSLIRTNHPPPEPSRRSPRPRPLQTQLTHYSTHYCCRFARAAQGSVDRRRPATLFQFVLSR
jgi:hypothetical protein